jgi:outer membrane protein assembly factor BamB
MPQSRTSASTRFIFAFLVVTCSASHSVSQTRAWLTQSHDAQHTGVSPVASQPLSNIHWKQRVDFAVPSGEIFIHYGSPLVTARNTVIVPVKAGSDSFRVVAHNGTNGAVLWRQSTGYQAPFAAFLPGMGPALFGRKLFIPDSGGRVIVRQDPDLASGVVSELYFYGQKNFQSDPLAYRQAVQINTPLTTDAHGNLYFGFLANGSTPIGLESGLARIAANGTGTWASAAFLSGDPFITEISMSCAPALSPDGKILYLAVSSGDFGYGYLLALNSTNLSVINRVRLTDPASGFDATTSDESSASPTVGPDGDVYYGVLENPFPSHNDRGWLLHFNSDLSFEKIPGSFGWDDTASIVDASLVPSYHGTSTYLLMTKYNNYAGISSGDGHNRVAVLDPNAAENDPVIPATQVMQEVMTQLGVTPDPGFPTFPGAVREWCINTAAVDPFTQSVIVNSEDGKLYRWDLTSNSLSEAIQLSGGIGEAYTPTVIGPDGTVYAINDAVLDAIGR